MNILNNLNFYKAKNLPIGMKFENLQLFKTRF